MSSRNFQWGIVAAAVSGDVREAPGVARRAGFAGLQYDPFAPGLKLDELSISGRREFKHMLGAQEQELAGLRVDVGARGIVPGADVDRVLARLDGAMETAAGLGCHLVCVEIGPLPSPPREAARSRPISPEEAGIIILPTFNAPPAPVTSEEPRPVDHAAISQVDAVLADLGRRADRYGVMVALRSELSSLAALERALKGADCPWFGVDLDPVALLRDEWSMDEMFSRLVSLVRHVRGRDALAGADRRTKPAVIGQGNTNWNELLANLDSAGYHGWITIDPVELMDRAAAAGAGLAYLVQAMD